MKENMEARWLCVIFCAIILTKAVLSEIPERVECSDPTCEEIISTARATSNYVSTDPNMLSFTSGQVINIKSKGLGPGEEMWKGELNGKIGFFPANIVKESKVFDARPKFKVPSTIGKNAVSVDITDLDDMEDIDQPADPVAESDPTDLDDTDDTEPEATDISNENTQIETDSTDIETDDTEIGTGNTELENDVTKTDNTDMQDDTEIANDNTEIGDDSQKAGVENNGLLKDPTELDQENEGGASTIEQSSEGVGMFSGLWGKIGGMFGNADETEAGSEVEAVAENSATKSQQMPTNPEELNDMLQKMKGNAEEESDEDDDADDDLDEEDEEDEGLDNDDADDDDDEVEDIYLDDGSQVEDDFDIAPDADKSSKDNIIEISAEAKEAESETIENDIRDDKDSEIVGEEMKKIDDSVVASENDQGKEIPLESAEAENDFPEVVDLFEKIVTSKENDNESENKVIVDEVGNDASLGEQTKENSKEDAKDIIKSINAEASEHSEINEDGTTIFGIDGKSTLMVDGTVIEWDDDVDIKATGSIGIDASMSMESTAPLIMATPALDDVMLKSVVISAEPDEHERIKPVEMTVAHVPHSATVDLNSESNEANDNVNGKNITDYSEGNDLNVDIQMNDPYHTLEYVSRKPLEMMEPHEMMEPDEMMEHNEMKEHDKTSKPDPLLLGDLNKEMPNSESFSPDDKTVDANNNEVDYVIESKSLIDEASEPLNASEEREGTPVSPEDDKSDSDPAKDQLSTPDSDHQTPDVDDQIYKEMLQDPAPSAWQDFIQGIDYAISIFDPILKTIVNILPASMQKLLTVEPLGLEPHRALVTFVFSISTLISISLCQLKGLFGGGSGRNARKLTNLAETLQKLNVVTTERDQLLEKLQSANAQIIEQGTRSTLTSSEVDGLRKKLDATKLNLTAVQRKLTEQDEEINDLKQQVDDITSTLESRDAEITQLNQQVTQMSEYSASIESQLVEHQNCLSQNQVSLLEVQSQLQANTEEVTVLQQCKDQLLLEADEWSEQNHSLKAQMEEMEENIKKYQDMVSFKENEIEVWKDCFKQLKILQDELAVDEEEGDDDKDETGDGGDRNKNEHAMSEKMQEKLQAMIDVANVNARLKAFEEDNKILLEKVRIETESRKEIEEQVQQFRLDAETSKDVQRRAEHREQEAITKLNVLQSYFHQKELEMQKELGEQQARQKDSVGQLESADSKSRLIKLEIDNLRAQVTDLKKEIETAESEHRKQLAANEKRVHENWLAARQAEREMKEAKSEAAMLRLKLVDMDRERERGSPMGPPLLRPLPTRSGIPPPGLMNGPPRPLPPPGPPFLGDRPSSQGRLPPFDDRPGSRGGPPPMFNDRPGSRGNHPGPPPPPGPSPNVHREGSPLDRDRMPTVPYLPSDRPVPPNMRDRQPPLPHMMDRDRPPLHPMDRDRPLPPDFRRPPSDLRAPLPPLPPMDGRRSPPGSYPRDRRTPPQYRGPPPPRGPPGPPPPSWRGPPPPDGRGLYPPELPPGSRPPLDPRTSSPRIASNSQSQSFV